uniref:Protein phosphatase n=1 Tax=Panagrellus redivivus TaxID=6233 RepID=A0A7E5A091_PANRE
MLNFTTRQLGRIAGQSAAPLVKELSAGLRSGATSSKAQVCAVIAASCLSTEAAPTSQVKPGSSSSVHATCCGFPKEFIGRNSCVLEHGVFGEDACFISKFKNVHVAGVADGVGGWRKYGIDPSIFSSRLMKHCAEIVEAGTFDPTRPDLIIAQAFTNLAEAPRPIGSSTACVVVVHQNVLYTANLGDSGFLVCRNGKIIHKSQEQTHYFNAPFQLTLLPETMETEGFIIDTPESSDMHAIELQKGDVVLLATDGLWDNVPEPVIAEALREATSTNIQAVCNTVALIARRLSHDNTHKSPFAQKAGEYGIATSGGKPDDITLVLLYIN